MLVALEFPNLLVMWTFILTEEGLKEDVPALSSVASTTSFTVKSLFIIKNSKINTRGLTWKLFQTSMSPFLT